MVDVNYLAVLASAVSAMIWGFLWYGPLFGKPWMKMMKLDLNKIKSMSRADMGKFYGTQFVGSLFMAFVLSHTLAFSKACLGETGVLAGLQTGF